MKNLTLVKRIKTLLNSKGTAYFLDIVNSNPGYEYGEIVTTLIWLYDNEVIDYNEDNLYRLR